tara:strand:+ start:252 stop:470 length:219 start_codon:yes stop_codon:yes gene_type:complete
MAKEKSEYKMIFEDSSLSDLQKYKKITNIYNNNSKFWTFVIGMNFIIISSLIIIPETEFDNSNYSPVIATKK